MRRRGGFIGANVTPSVTAASGVWALPEQESAKRAGTWPLVPLNGVSAGLQLWLDASDANTLYDATTGGSLVAANGGVARWEDKSGNARHATQGTSGSRPIRKTAIQNGLGVLRFDGTNDWINLPTDFRWWPTGTVFVVLDNAGADKPWYGAHRSDEDPDIRLNTSTHSGYWYYGGNYKQDAGASHYDAIGTGTVRTIVLNNTAYKSYSNGTLKNSTTLSAAVTANNPTFSHTLGGYKYSGGIGDAYAAIDICEVVMYDSALSDTNRAAVESYLLAKWGIT